MFKFILKGSIGTVDILELQGSLVESSSGEVRDKLWERVKQGVTDIVLLCSMLTHIDSSGVSLLIEISDQLQPRKGRLHLVTCTAQVMVPMKSLGMLHFFQFYKSEEEAFRALKLAPDPVLETSTKWPAINTNLSQTKRQVAIKDHIRNKMILFKHYETSLVQDIILYLQSTYAHFRGREIELNLRGKYIPPTATLSQLIEVYGYGQKDMLEVKDITPEPPNFAEMMKRGGKLYSDAVIALLLQKGHINQEVAKSVQEVADLNQEAITTTLIEGNYVPQPLFLQTIADFCRCESSDLEDRDFPKAKGILPKEKALALCAVPIRQEGKKIWVAVCNPLDKKCLESLQKQTLCEVVPVLSTEVLIRRKIETWYAPPPRSVSAAEMQVSSPPTEELLLPQSGYFSVADNKATTGEDKLEVQQDGWDKAMPGLLADGFATLSRIEQTLGQLQSFFMQLMAKRSSDEIYDFMLETIVTWMATDCAVILLYQRTTDRFTVHQVKKMNKEKKENKKESKQENSLEDTISQSLLSEVKKGQGLVLAHSSETTETHVGIPFVSGDRVVGLLYLISSQNVPANTLQLLKMLVMFFRYAGVVIENEKLKTKIEELTSKK
jgi:anti-anti-sigma factor